MQYHIKQKVLSLHGAYEIFDETDKKCYHIKQNAVSITNKTHFLDMEDHELATIHRKLVSMHATHYIEMANGDQATISEEKMIQLHDNYEIGGFGWTIKGGVLGHDFQILDANGSMIAESQQKWISVGDKVAVNVYVDSQAVKVLAVLITILLIHRDRENAVAHNPENTQNQ